MAKRNGSTLTQDRRQYQQLGALGSLVGALPPVQRAFLRDAVRVSTMAVPAREVDRAAVLTLIDSAFDEIEQAARANGQGAA